MHIIVTIIVITGLTIIITITSIASHYSSPLLTPRDQA